MFYCILENTGCSSEEHIIKYVNQTQQNDDHFKTLKLTSFDTIFELFWGWAINLFPCVAVR